MRALALGLVLLAAACGSSNTGSCTTAPPGSLCDSAPDDATPFDTSSDGARDVGPDAAIPCSGLCGPGTTCDGTRCVPVDAGPDVASTDASAVDVTDAPLDVAQDSVADATDGADAERDAATDAACAVMCDVGCVSSGVAEGDLNNCGRCGVRCTSTAPSTRPVCFAGMLCEFRCVAGWGDCDRSTANGCETQLNTNSNCGYCGRSCETINGYTCMMGACVRP